MSCMVVIDHSRCVPKVEDMRTGGYEPYGYTWERTDTAQELQSKYVDLASATEANEEKDHVSVAGRIMARRVFGKLAFLTLRDDSGPIQVCLFPLPLFPADFYHVCNFVWLVMRSC